MTGVDAEREVVLTDTAKSKQHRYLSEWAVREALDDPDEVYRERGTGNYLVRTSRTTTTAQYNHEREETIIRIVAVEDDGQEVVVITQTGTHDHYHWEDYDEVAELGAVPEPDDQ